MKKKAQGGITNPERDRRAVLRLTAETVRLLCPEALARAMSGCNTTSFTTESPGVSKDAC